MQENCLVRELRAVAEIAAHAAVAARGTGALAAALTTRTQQLCIGLEDGIADIFELVTPTTTTRLYGNGRIIIFCHGVQRLLTFSLRLCVSVAYYLT